MSEYESINCSCGRSYLSKDFASTCPGCGKTNWSSKGALFAIVVVIAIIFFLGLTLGSLIWAIAAIAYGWNRWTFVGSSILAIVCLFTIQEFLDYNEYPVWSLIAYICNGIGLILGILRIINSQIKPLQLVLGIALTGVLAFGFYKLELQNYFYDLYLNRNNFRNIFFNSNEDADDAAAYESTDNSQAGKDIIYQYALVNESNNPNNFERILHTDLNYFHSATNRSLSSVIRDVKSNYLNKWTIIKDSVASVTPDPAVPNNYNFTRYYDIKRKADGKIFQYKISGYYTYDPNLNRIVGVKDDVTTRIRSFFPSESNQETRIVSTPEPQSNAILKLNGKLRTGPSIVEQVFLEIPKGSPVKIIEKSGSYWKVDYNGQVGYLNELYLAINSSTSKRATEVSNSSSGANSNSLSTSFGNKVDAVSIKVRINYGLNDVNVRQKPVDGKVVGKINGGEIYTISRSYKVDTPSYILKSDFSLTDLNTRESSLKEKNYRFLSAERYGGSYEVKYLNDRGKVSRAYIPSNYITINTDYWYFIEDLNGWVISTFCTEL